MKYEHPLSTSGHCQRRANAAQLNLPLKRLSFDHSVIQQMFIFFRLFQGKEISIENGENKKISLTEDLSSFLVGRRYSVGGKKKSQQPHQ